MLGLDSPVSNINIVLYINNIVFLYFFIIRISSFAGATLSEEYFSDYVASLEEVNLFIKKIRNLVSRVEKGTIWISERSKLCLFMDPNCTFLYLSMLPQRDYDRIQYVPYSFRFCR